MNYWLFQGTPDRYDLEKALLETIDNSNWNWMVTKHKDHIRIGDKVIIWIAGEKAGVYAMATVISNIKMMHDKPQGYSIDNSIDVETERVDLIIDRNLVQENKVLYKDKVLKNKDLIKLKQGISGTNFSSDIVEYTAIIDMLKE